jgi:putative Mg2+ transporter-C (MgtC) family protein
LDWKIVLLRLSLALFCGGLIGLDREKAHRPAGLRTNILVCIGSALAMLTGEFLFTEFNVANLDPTRIGAQVISGIGFLGAGTIIMKKGSVYGLTTAASLWAVACTGLAIGAGFYWGALFITILIYFTLLVLRKFERDRKYIIKHILKIRVKDEQSILNKITHVLEEKNIEISEAEKIPQGENIILIFTLILDDHVSKEEIIQNILIFKEVEKIEFIDV